MRSLWNRVTVNERPTRRFLSRTRLETCERRNPPGSGQLLRVTIPTGPGLTDGLDAFGFGGLAAFGLRSSLLDFFWPLAIAVSSAVEVTRLSKEEGVTGLLGPGLNHALLSRDHRPRWSLWPSLVFPCRDLATW